MREYLVEISLIAAVQEIPHIDTSTTYTLQKFSKKLMSAIVGTRSLLYKRYLSIFKIQRNNTKSTCSLSDVVNNQFKSS